MLPVTVQFIVAMLAYAPGERMARRIDYLQEENRVFKDAFRAATGKTRIALTDEQRRRLATKGKALTPAEREECCQVVRPSTIVACLWQLVARKYDSSRVRRPGRPRKANDIREPVLRIASENRNGKVQALELSMQVDGDGRSPAGAAGASESRLGVHWNP